MMRLNDHFRLHVLPVSVILSGQADLSIFRGEHRSSGQADPPLSRRTAGRFSGRSSGLAEKWLPASGAVKSHYTGRGLVTFLISSFDRFDGTSIMVIAAGSIHRRRHLGQVNSLTRSMAGVYISET